MDILDIVILAFYILLWLGVGFIVFEIIKQLIDKKALETELISLQSELIKFQEDTHRRLFDYQNSYDSLYEKFQKYQIECNKKLKSSSQNIEQILNFANQLIEQNNVFFQKLTLINDLLSQDQPEKEKVQKLVKEISRDIENQEKLKNEQELIYQHQIDEMDRAWQDLLIQEEKVEQERAEQERLAQEKTEQKKNQHDHGIEI